MQLKQDNRNPRRILGDVRKDEFNTLISLIKDVLSLYKQNPDVDASDAAIRDCELLIGQLTNYSYFDVDNDIVKVSFFVKELNMLLDFMVFVSTSPDDVDHFNNLVDSGNVNIWKNK